MINVQREAAVPSSLESEEIQEWITATIKHSEDPENNSKPGDPPPYRSSDLLDAFDRCFHGKCYLTEMQFANSYTLDVEHLLSKGKDPVLRYQWSNLFPCWPYANSIKPKKTPSEGYLDPCNADHDVEKEILYALSMHGENPVFEARDPKNQKAVNTCDLLNRLHNGHDPNTIKGTEELRQAIRKRYTEILHKITEWQHHPDGSQAKFQAKQDLKALLSRKAAFTMLMRSMVPVMMCVPPDFLD